jgi:hypothetical protein
MRTTVDLPDDLLRRAKSEAALQGRTLKDLVEEGLRHVLGLLADTEKPAKRRVTAHDLLKDLILDDDGPDDLATNPKYFDDFGR